MCRVYPLPKRRKWGAVWAPHFLFPLNQDLGFLRGRHGPLVVLDALFEVGFDFLRENLALPKAVADLRELGLHEFVEALLPLAHLIDRHVIDEAVRQGVDDHDLLLNRQRRILGLLEHLYRARAAIELTARGRVEVRRERR